MKRAVFFLLSVLLLSSLAAYSYNGDITVYVTASGSCYHRENCSYLKSRIPLTLEDAVEQGYRRCSRCHPPTLGEDRTSDQEAYMNASERNDQKEAERIRNEQLENALKDAADSREQVEALQREIDQMKQRRFYAGISAVVGLPALYLLHLFQIRKTKRQAAEAALSAARQEIALQQRAIQRARQEQNALFRGPAAPLPEPAKRTKHSAPKKRSTQKGTKPTQIRKTSQSRKSWLKSDEFPLHPDFAIPYRERYSGKSISKEAGVPDGFWFDEDDLPHGEALLGVDPFQVFGSPKGKLYHAPDCSRMRNAREMNLCAAIAEGRTPCPYCHPATEVPPWVSEYQKISRLRRQCSIDMLP